jgi:hypothetical protein
MATIERSVWGWSVIEGGEETAILDRTAVIDGILAAARKPCPDIVECFELLGTDGKWHSPYGFPFGVHSTGDRRSIGFAYRSREGMTYGLRGKAAELACGGAS